MNNIEDNKITISGIQDIERTWIGRAKNQGYKYGSKLYSKNEMEFFCGAMQALSTLGIDNAMYTKWTICLMIGRNIITEDQFKN